MAAVTVLALLIPKVLDKARELSAKLFAKELLQPIAEPNKGKTTQIIPQTDNPPKQETSEIPSKPVMSAAAAVYPKLLKIYKELNRQNGIIFDAERERNELELERDSLKGFTRLTKKGELQSRIDHKNEEIDLLKIGLSGIVKRYGFQTVHDFCKAFAAAKTAYDDYRNKSDKWEERYGKAAYRKEKESVHNRLQNYQKENADQHIRQTSKNRDKGAR